MTDTEAVVGSGVAQRAERYGGQSHCRVRGENSIIVIIMHCSMRYKIKSTN